MVRLVTFIECQLLLGYLMHKLVFFDVLKRFFKQAIIWFQESILKQIIYSYMVSNIPIQY